MVPEIRIYLFDILNSIEEIESFFDGTIKEFSFFKSDRKTRRAVERNIEIIGEAANRVYKIDNDIALPGYKTGYRYKK
jgi:uncharacterized protein with HEPN domain